MIPSGRALKQIRDYLALTFACFLFAYAWEGFMIPNGMSAGGVMGLCTVLEYATGAVIPAQWSYFALNAVLIVVAVFAMGIGFGFKTIYCIAVSSLIMQFQAQLTPIHCIPGEFMFVEEKILIPVIAGMFEALGIGLVLRFGGSTGGTDIVALMVHKYWPISLSSVFVVSDFCVVLLLLLLPDKNFNDMVYGMVEIVTFSLMIDFVVGGKKSSYQLLVFSQHYKQIADHIINDMERGVTVIKAQGWFSKKEREILLILVSQKEFPSLSRVIKEIDPRAFMSVTKTNSVYGEGFDEIKTGVKIFKSRHNGNQKGA